MQPHKQHSTRRQAKHETIAKQFGETVETAHRASTDGCPTAAQCDASVADSRLCLSLRFFVFETASQKEEELEALFSRYGTLQAVDIKRDKLTGNNLGYGFVQLSSRAEATRAKTALQGREVFGRKIRIGWAQKNTTLFVGDLDGSINTTQLVRAFEPFGHIIVEETFVKQPSGKYVRCQTKQQ